MQKLAKEIANNMKSKNDLANRLGLTSINAQQISTDLEKPAEFQKYLKNVEAHL